MAIIDSAARSEGDNVSEIQSLSLRVRDITQSVDWWNTAMLWGLAFAAIAAIFVVIATRVVVAKSKELSQVQDQLGDAKDKQLALDLKAKDTQIELAKKGAAEATATAKGFESKIADSDARVKSAEAQVASSMARSDEAVAQVKTADARIAEAQRDAARANETAERERLARLQLESRLADRVVTLDQERRLKVAFSRLKGQTVDIGIFGETSEVAFFTGAIVRCMDESGVLLNQVRPSGGAAVKGVLIGVKPNSPVVINEVAASVIGILRESGGGVGAWDFEKLIPGGGMMGVSSTAGAATLWDSPLRIFIGGK